MPDALLRIIFLKIKMGKIIFENKSDEAIGITIFRKYASETNTFENTPNPLVKIILTGASGPFQIIIY